MTGTSQRMGGSGRERRLLWCAAFGMAMLVLVTFGARGEPGGEGAKRSAVAPAAVARLPGPR